MPVFEITAPDGRTFDVEGADAQGAYAALTKALGGGAPAQSEQEMVGFGTRSQREATAPETDELKKEVEIAKRMARQRPGSEFQESSPIAKHLPDFLNPNVTGAKDVFLQNYTFGLGDEAKAAGSGIASLLQGDGFGYGYDVEKEADRRMREEYAAKNPTTNLVASVAGMLAGGLPAKASTATTLSGRALEGAGQAASQSAIYGFAEGDEGPYGRLGGAAIGGVTGGLVGGAVPLVTTGVKAATGGIRNTINTAINPEKEAARRVAQSLEKDAIAGGDGLDNIAFYKAKQAGNPVANMDRGGKNVQNLARSAANGSADAQQAMEAVYKPRFAQQVERIDDTLKSQSKLGGKPEDFMAMAGDASRKANKRYYDEAFDLGSGDVWSPRLERLSQAPAVERALKSAITKFKDNAILDGFGGLNSRIGLDEAGNIAFRNNGGLTARPDLRLWDLAKRELDSMASQAKRTGSADERTYTRLAKELRDTLDTMGPMGQAYKKARETAAKFFGAEDAFEAGRTFASQKGLSARDAIRGVSKMSVEERKLFREGYIQAKRDLLAELRTNRDATLSVMQSPGEVGRARVALGKDGAKKLEAQLEIERAMDLIRGAMGNSTTARQLAQLGLASAAGSGGMAASGNTDPTSLTVGALAGAATRFGKGKLDERLAAQIGKLLASNEPGKITMLINAASASPKYMETIRAISQSLGQEAPGLLGREITNQAASP